MKTTATFFLCVCMYDGQDYAWSRTVVGIILSFGLVHEDLARKVVN